MLIMGLQYLRLNLATTMKPCRKSKKLYCISPKNLVENTTTCT